MNQWKKLVGGMLSISLGFIASESISNAATAQIKAGENHTLMLRSNGTIWSCGNNELGQLGDGSTTARNVPTKIGTATDWAMISAGQYHSMAIKADGTLWAWGDNTYGQLGTGADLNGLVHSFPVQVGTDKNWKSVVAGDYHTLALKTDGTLWAWGDSADGTLGTGETYSGIILPLPQQIGADTDWVSATTGSGHTMAVKSNGTLWGWGSNGSGQQGDQTNLEARAPIRIGTDTDWAAVTVRGNQTVARKKDGKLFAWGLNMDGQLGDGTFENRDLPTKVNDDNDWLSIASGATHTVAVKSNGTLWTWGNNTEGQCGDGKVGNKRSAPLQVSNATHWVAVDAGENHTVASTNDGTLWSMGDNSFGQLCDGSNTAKASPLPNISPLSGDIDQDGAVGIADALKALRITVGLTAPGALEIIAGDVGPLAAGLPNPDGAINISDSLVILRKTVGLDEF